MDRKTLESLQRACHIRLTPEEEEAFLTELQEIEDSFPELTEEAPVCGASELPYSLLRDDIPVRSSCGDPEGRRDGNGFYRVREDGHEQDV